VELQEKMQIVIKYTKSEMDHQITQKFKDAEKRQRQKMLNKIEEGNNIIRNLNHMRLELEQLKIEFEEMNTKCEKYIEKKEKLKVNLSAQKSDFKNLEKKLNQIIQENKELKIKYDNAFMKKKAEVINIIKKTKQILIIVIKMIIVMKLKNTNFIQIIMKKVKI
jgi:hypothetical protein